MRSSRTNLLHVLLYDNTSGTDGMVGGTDTYPAIVHCGHRTGLSVQSTKHGSEALSITALLRTLRGVLERCDVVKDTGPGSGQNYFA